MKEEEEGDRGEEKGEEEKGWRKAEMAEAHEVVNGHQNFQGPRIRHSQNITGKSLFSIFDENAQDSFLIHRLEYFRNVGLIIAIQAF